MRKIYFLLITCYLITISHLSHSQISLNKSVNLSTADPGVPITYTLQINCPGTAGTCNNIVVTDVLHSRLEYLGASAPTGNVQSINFNAGTNQVTITMNPVLNGTTDEVQIVAAIKPFTENGLLIPNSAQATGGVNSNTVNTTVTNGFVYNWSNDIFNYKEAVQEASAGNGVYYSFMWANLSQNHAINNLVFIEDVPDQMRVTNFSPVTYTDASGIFYNIYYKTNLNSTWTLGLGGNYNLAVKYFLTPGDIGVPNGQYITELRFNYLQPIPGGGQYYHWLPNLDMGRIIGTIEPSTPVGTFVNNCLSSTGTINSVAKTASHCAGVTTSTPTQGFLIEKEIPNQLSGYLAGDTLTFNLIGGITEVTGFDYVNPTVIDLLPPELEYISYTATELWENPFGGTNLQPLFTKIDNYLGTGQTYLKFRYNYTITRQASRVGKAFQIQIKAKIKEGVPSGQYINKSYHTSDLGGEVFPSNWWAWYDPSLYERVIDVTNLDADGSFSDTLYASYRKFNVVFPSGAGLESIKWVKGTLDSDYSRYPVIGNTSPGGTADYKLVVKNSGDVAMKDIKIIDILPFVGDKGVIDLSNRDSEWRPFLIDQIESSVPGVTTFYSTVSNPCRDELTPGIPNPCDMPNWSTIPPVDITTVQSLKFDFGALVMQPGDTVVLKWPMRVPLNTPTTGETAWNSFGFISTRNDNNSVLLATEPIKVGVQVLPAEPAIISDYVWYDSNINGLQDEPTSNGLNDLRVDLYEMVGSNRDPINDNLVTFTLTSDKDGNPGYYRFSNLPPGNYYVGVHLPTQYIGTTANVGTDDSIDSDGSLLVNISGDSLLLSDIVPVITGNEEFTNVDFGIHPICYSPISASITANTPVCSGDTLFLTGTAVGATGFSWSGPNGFSSTSQNPFLPHLTFANSGIYTLLVNDGIACSASATVNVVIPEIQITNITVSSCIDQPLQDVAQVSVTVAWSGSQPGDKIAVKIFDKIETINIATLSSPQTITFNVPADGSVGNSVAANWINFGSGSCGTSASFDSPIACSSNPLACEKILFICGEHKPADADAWDHGFVNYLNLVGVDTLTPALTKLSGSGYGLFDPMNPTIQLNVNLNVYTLVIISPSTESELKNTLLQDLKNYKGGILMMNYTQADELGMAPSNGTYSFQNYIYSDNTNQVQIYNYDNQNSYFDEVFTATNYFPSATPEYWLNANNMGLNINGVNYKYDAGTPLAGVSNEHGSRVYLGYHTNAIYHNAQNGGAMPAPEESYLVPSAHFTLEGKAIFDQAILDAADGIKVFAYGDTVCISETIQLNAIAIGANSYTWNGPNGFVSGLQNPQILNSTVLNSGIYTVTVTDLSGCSASATAQVLVNLPPNINISGNDTLTCSVTTVSRTASSGVSYSWTNGLGTNATANISAPGTYTVTVTAANGCTATASVEVIQDITVPTVNISGNDTLTCSVTTVSRTASGGVSYSWTNGLGTNATANISAPGTYTVTVTAANGCTATATVEVIQDITVPTVNISGNDTLTCSVTTVNRTASGGVSYSWTNGLGTNATANISAPGTYTVTVTAANGCTATASVEVIQDITVPTVNISGNDTLTCSVTTVSRTASGGVSYSWTNGLGTNATANISAPGTYTVTVTAANGCTATASVEVIQDITVPTVNISGNDTLTCSVTTVSRTASGGVSYSWTNGLGTNATANISAPGTYTVTVTAANGCTATATVEVIQDITVPTVNISGNDTLTCSVTTVNRTASGGVSYSWTNGLGTNATANISAPGTYTVTVTAANGCTATASVEVIQDITVPTVNISGNDTLTCSVTTVSRTASGGVSYSWTNGLGNNATANISTPGTYTVMVTAANGCTATASVEVMQDITVPTVNISGNDTLTCSVTTVSRTASGGVNYSWSNGLGSNATANISASGTYTVTVTAANGCTTTASVEVMQDITVPTVNISGNDTLTCSVTTVSRTASGGVSYSWSDGLGSNATASINTPGTYTVTVTAENGCTATASVEVIQDITVPTVNISGNDTLTCSVTTVSRTASGGVSYSWSDGLGSNATASINTPGTYTVTVTAENGCTATASVEVIQDITVPTVNISGNDTLTCSVTTVSRTASGGVSYSWSDGLGGNATANISAPGTYTVTVTAENGCTATALVEVIQDITVPTVNISGNDTLTCSVTTVSRTATGGVSYSWSDGLGSNATANISTPGTYTVTVTATNGCTETASVEVIQDITVPTVNISGNDTLTCSVTTVSRTASGGVSYSWSDGLGSNATANISTPGTYTVTVTAANGCTATASVEVIQDITVPTVNISGNDTLTCSVTTVSRTASGGVSYSWSDGLGINATANISAPGTYTVTVTAANGCTATASVEVIQDITVPTVNISGNDTLTCSVTTVSRTASGAVSYSWSDGLGSNATANISAPGTYTVTVTAENGCIATATVEVIQDITVPTVNISGNDTLTCSVTTVSRTASGGVSYSWSDGLGSNATANISAPGIYTVTVTAANGCTATATVEVMQDITVPMVNISGNDTLTCSVTTVSRTASGGISYSWSNGLGSNATANINTPGTYTVTVTAANGCTETATVEVIQDITGPTVNISGNDTLTCSVTTVSRTASGGVSYSWSNGLGSNATANISAPGTYTVTVTAENGCTATASVEVIQDITVPTVNISGNDTLTCSVTTVSRTASGGVSYSWSDGLGGNATANISAPGTYTVTVTAENGCTATALVEVIQDITVPTVNISGNDTLTCSVTTVSRTATGGVSYSWSDGLGSNATANISTPGTYTVTVTAANGCTETASVEVIQDITVPTVNISGNDTLTCLVTTVSRTASGGVSYSWSDGLGSNATANISTPGTYTVTVTAANGCTATASVEVIQDITVPTVNISGNDTLTCSVTTVSRTASGGVSYSWSDGLGINATANISAPGTYTVTVTAANGCTATASVEVIQDITVPTVNISGNDTLTCSVTTVSRTASGGVSYSWSDGLGSNATANISAPGTYTVTVTAENGCIATATVEVIQDITVPTVNISGNDTLTCSVTTVSRTASGGVSYSWSDGLGSNATANISAPGIYTVTVTAANGCTATATVEVMQDITVPMVNISGNDTLTCSVTTVSRTASGGISYSWSNGLGSNATANINTPGTYTVTVTAANGCTETATVEVIQDITGPTVNISGNDTLTCSVTTVSRTASGGVSYSWSDGLGSNATANINTPGTYTVTVTAANGCTATATVEVIQDITIPTVNISGNDTLTCSVTTVSRTASGGVSYSWSDGLGSNATANISTPGTYTVTVTAANGCTETATVEVIQDITGPTVNISGNDTLTCSVTTVSRTATGGVSYSWSDGLGSNATANINAPGTYTVTVTAANGCTATASVEVIQDITVPTVIISGNDTLTCSVTTVSRTASGGVSYSWSDGLGTNATANISTPGTYTVTVTAENGCTATATVEVMQDITVPMVNISGNDTLTCSVTTVSRTASGGVSYSWSDGLGSNATANISAPGTYTVTVTAENGCTTTASVEVIQDITVPTVNISGNDTLTCSVTTVSRTASGVVSYSWSGGLGNNATANISAPGTYTVTVTAENGCTTTASVEVIQDITVPTVNISGNDTLTCSVTTVSRTASGGVSYSWSDGLGSNATANISTPGTYTVTVTAANGCTATASVEVIQDITVPTVNISGNDTLTCSVTTVSRTASGGVSYSWSDGLGSNATANISAPGTYTVTVTAENGCTTTASVEVIQDITVPTVNISGNDTLTCSVTTVSRTASGGVSYSWSDGLGINATANISAPGTYTVTVTAANGCTATASVEVIQDITVPMVNISGNDTLTCSVTTVSRTASGGVSYSWSDGLGSNATANISAPGTYTVTVTAENGCTATASVEVVSDSLFPVVTFVGIDTLTCSKTSFYIVASGADEYLWLNGNIANDSLLITTPGIYTVTATNSNGCTAMSSVEIIQDISIPNIQILGTDTLKYANQFVLRYVNTYDSINWLGGLGSSDSIWVNTPGQYIVSVIGSNGCVAYDTTVVIQLVYGSIGDFVWEDINKDGYQDSTESGVENVVVELLNSLDQIIRTSLTDTLGRYLFDSLSDGVYRVRFQIPSGFKGFSDKNHGSNSSKDSDVYTDSYLTDNIHIITNIPSEKDKLDSADAGLIRFDKATIGNLVWLDQNANGIQDSGEMGLNGVEVLLSGLNVLGDSVMLTTLTDTMGNYLFENLEPGWYSVQVISPLGYYFSQPFMGADTTINSDSDPVTGWMSLEFLDEGEVNLTYDAGLYQYAGMGDWVWNDQNRNGVQDSSEVGLSGIQVILSGIDGAGNLVSKSDTTDSLGYYLFENLVPGVYNVNINKPMQWQYSPSLIGGNSEKDSDFDIGLGHTTLLNLTSGMLNLHNDIGLNELIPEIELLKSATLLGKGKLGDTVRYDFLVRNIGENKLRNVYIIDTLIQNTPIQVIPDSLEIGQTGTASALYFITASDINRGYIINSATVYGTDPEGDIVEDLSDDAVDPSSDPNDPSFTPLPQVDLSLTISKYGDCEVNVSDTVRFMVVLSRQDSLALDNITVVKLNIDSTLQIISDTATSGILNSLTGEWLLNSTAFSNDTLIISALAKTTTGGLQCVVGEITESEYYDIDSTPNNWIETEDDYAKACVSIPLKICSAKNQSVELTAPLGFASYQWYLNGNPIDGATSNIYVANAAGNYTVLTDGNTCNTCCPIVVKDDCECPPVICVPFKVTKLP